jgi:serine/threonine protein kinase
VNPKLSSEDYLHQLEAKYGERRKAEFKKESPMVQAYFEAVSKRLSGIYTTDKVLAVGGTGIVHLGIHERFPQQVILKINRPNVDPEAESMVEHEAHILPTLNHPNIIRVLDIGKISEFTPNLSYIVEPFITGSKQFFTFDKDQVDRTWLHAKIEKLKEAMPHPHEWPTDDEAGQATRLVVSLLGDLAALFSQWVSLLNHLHSNHDCGANLIMSSLFGENG